MNILPVGLLALLLGTGVALEGLDAALGGEVYLASVRQLAQAADAVAPSPVPASESAAPPPPPPPPPADVATQPTPAPQPAPPPPPPPPEGSQAPPPQPLPPQPSGRPEPGLEQGGGFGYEEGQQDFVDPREIQQVQREIRDLRSQIRQLTNRIRKNAAFADELARMSAMSAELDQAQSAIAAAVSSGGSPRDAIQDFRDSQYWDQLNKIRGKAELPREIKQIETSIKRLERLLKVKSVQQLGLQLENVQARVNEMREHASAVQAHLTAGNYDEAMEEMQFFHEGGHPGEIEGTIFRIRDIKQMLRRVKDEGIRTEVDKVLQEVVDAFNAGEYRDARETLDEYADDLQRLIQRFLTVRIQKGRNREDSFSRIKNLENLIRSKLGEPSEAPSSAR